MYYKIVTEHWSSGELWQFSNVGNYQETYKERLRAELTCHHTWFFKTSS